MPTVMPPPMPQIPSMPPIHEEDNLPLGANMEDPSTRQWATHFATRVGAQSGMAPVAVYALIAIGQDAINRQIDPFQPGAYDGGGIALGLALLAVALMVAATVGITIATALAHLIASIRPLRRRPAMLSRVFQVTTVLAGTLIFSGAAITSETGPLALIFVASLFTTNVQIARRTAQRCGLPSAS